MTLCGKRCIIHLGVVLAVLILISGVVQAAGGLYVEDEFGNRDTLVVSNGIGTQLDLRLMADENLTGFRMYRVDLGYEKTILDTLLVSDDNSLFQNASGNPQILFESFLREDSTIFRIQSLMIGAGITVDGPGLLATMEMEILDSGIVDLAFRSDSTEVRDVYNELIPDIEEEGLTILIDVPPSEFNLLEPGYQDEDSVLISESLHFEWEPSIPQVTGDQVKYELIYSTDPSFMTNTVTVGDLVDPWYDVPATQLEETTYYWDVRAYGSYGFERWSNQSGEFSLIINYPPTPFNLLEPLFQEDLTLNVIDDLHFEWEESTTPVAGDYIRYELMYGTDPTFQVNTTVVTDLEFPYYDVSAMGFQDDTYYWIVKAYNTRGIETWSNQTDMYFTLTVLGVAPDPFSLLFPANNYLIDITDGPVTFDWEDPTTPVENDTINFTLDFGMSGNLPVEAFHSIAAGESSEYAVDTPEYDLMPVGEWIYWGVNAENKLGYSRYSSVIPRFKIYMCGDVNFDRLVNILDILFMIDYKFGTGPEPEIPEAADVDNISPINILDIIFLIDYKFNNGEEPICP